MIKKIYIVFSFAALFLFGSCNKETWNESAKINIVSESNEGKQSHIGANTYILNSGKLAINKMILVGERIQAEDISIETKKAFSINIKSEELSEEINLDIPQGTYNSLRHRLIFNDNSLELNYLVINNNPFVEDKILIFNLDLNDLFGDILDLDQEKEILIVSDINYNLVININWHNLLKNINQGLIINSQKESINGMDHIIVNSYTNSDLFSLIESNIQSSIKLSIK